MFVVERAFKPDYSDAVTIAMENEGQVALKYYSAAVSNIFVTDPIPYVNDEILGTVAEPYTPKWQKN